MQKKLNVKKTAAFAVIINCLQAGMMLFLLIYLYVSRKNGEGITPLMILATGAALVVGFGAVLDIRDAISARSMVDTMESMEKTMGNMETLNNTLRAQRHDFLNHLQVVYSLMEMEEYGEANSYIEKVYGDITSLSRVMKTANPAINALLRVKVATCEKQNIQVTLDIRSPWKDLPIPGWEMCKVLSNLIDNAADALEEVENRKLVIELKDDLHAYRFSVANNGPMIPVSQQKNIFQAGVTSKSQGHGMGLFIVRKTLKQYGGDIQVESVPGRTAFEGYVPRENLSKPYADETEYEEGTPA